MIEQFFAQNVRQTASNATPFPNPPSIVASGTATTQSIGGETYRFGSFSGTTFAEGNGSIAYGGAIAKLFDNVTTGGYEFDCPFGNTVAVLFPQSRLYTNVTITPSSDGTIYYPNQFEVLGSNNGSTWTTLLTVSSMADWNSQTPRTWNFSNGTNWLYYGLKINNGAYTPSGGSGQTTHPSRALFNEVRWT